MHMKSAQLIVSKLKKMDRKYWSNYRVAKFLDISQSQLKQLLTETKNPSGKTIMSLLDLAVEHAGFGFEEIFISIKSDLSKLPKITRERKQKKLE